MLEAIEMCFFKDEYVMDLGTYLNKEMNFLRKYPNKPGFIDHFGRGE